jgi:hypothetical protein
LGRTITGTADQIVVTNGNGDAGNPVISAVIASQAEAVTGTNNTKLMTPLRAAQARIDPENRIINGAFDFWQRGTSFTGNVYGADRWINYGVGGTRTMSRQEFTVGDTLGTNNPTYFLRQTVSGQSTSAQIAFVEQPIEGVRSYAGQTITILGWARRSSGSGNMAVEIFQYFGTGGSPSSSVFVAPQTVTLTSSFAPFAVTIAIPSITGKTVGTNNTDYLRVAFWTSAGSDYNARTNSLGLQTIGVDLWGIHIKVGTHTTDAVSLYKQPELGPEFARCQRYYQVSAVGRVIGQFYTTSAARLSWALTVPMRAAPNLSIPIFTVDAIGSGACTFANTNLSSSSTQAISFDGISGSPTKTIFQHAVLLTTAIADAEF